MEQAHDDDFAEGNFDLADMRELMKQGANRVEGFPNVENTPESTDLDSRFNVVMSLSGSDGSDGSESFRYGS
jgi:hypothetical protein